MAAETSPRSKKRYVIAIVVFGLLMAGWTALGVARLLTGNAAWGPQVGGLLPNGTGVYFQARPAGFETDDRLTVVPPGAQPEYHWVDQVHGGFAHVVLKYNTTGTQVWVESDGKVGASIDLTTRDFRAEADTQHEWAVYGTGTRLDAGSTSSLRSLLLW